MKEQVVEIPTAAGRMETWVTHPEQDGPFPPVIVYMDVWGVREELYDIARRVAAVGYYAMVPDFYYRQGRVRSDFRDETGKSISFIRLDKKVQEKVLAIQKELTDAMVVEDTGALLDSLGKAAAADGRAVGAIGYCMGGRHVLQAAGHYPDKFAASASLHGTTLISDAADSAHRGIDRIRGELYCGFAEHDPFAPLPMVEELTALLKPCKVRYRYEIHQGAEHGYALPDRDVFDKRAAERDWELIFAMFHRQIPPYTAVAKDARR